jgi:hypothetical protein
MSSVWRARRASTSTLLFAFPLPQPRLPSIFTRPHLDSADKDKANQLRCILHYMYSSFWTLHAMLDEAPKTRPPWMLTPQRTRVPSARGSDLIGVMISILTLCLASTGLETIIRAIASSLRLPDLTVQCSDILRRPTARFNTGLSLYLPFSAASPPVTSAYFSAASRSVSSGLLQCVHLSDQNCQITQMSKDLSSP